MLLSRIFTALSYYQAFETWCYGDKAALLANSPKVAEMAMEIEGYRMEETRKIPPKTIDGVTYYGFADL